LIEQLLDWFQLAVVRQVLRREIGLKIVEVESDKANVEGGDVLWTGKHSLCFCYRGQVAKFTEEIFRFFQQLI